MTRTLSKFTGTDLLRAKLARSLLAMAGLNLTACAVKAHQGPRIARLGGDRHLRPRHRGAARERLGEVAHFETLLRQNRMHLASVVANRIHPPPLAEDLATARALSGPLRERAGRDVGGALLLGQQDAAGVAELGRVCAPTPVVRIPRFEVDVHDLTGLWRTGDYLTGEKALGVP